VIQTCVVLFLALILGASALADPPCQAARDLSEIISSKSQPLPPERFSKITKQMTVYEILGLLGPAARDIGSGLYFLQWDSTDGRVFTVTATSLCDRPRGLRFAPKQASNNRLGGIDISRRNKPSDS
jgi:hypothetical protein